MVFCKWSCRDPDAEMLKERSCTRDPGAEILRKCAYRILMQTFWQIDFAQDLAQVVVEDPHAEILIQRSWRRDPHTEILHKYCYSRDLDTDILHKRSS